MNHKIRRGIKEYTRRALTLLKIILRLIAKSTKIVRHPAKLTKLVPMLTKLVRHPEIVIQIYRNVHYDKVLNKGERAIIYNWKKAINRRESDWNWGQLAHIYRYEWASSFVKGLKVLDNGCAAGCGTRYLASNGADTVVGVDYSWNAIEEARRRYQVNSLWFVNADSLQLPFKNASFDAVVSFDVLEHISEEKQEKFVFEIARILKLNGIAIIGTPNAEGDETALIGCNNPFHKYELNVEEFERLLCEFFEDVSMKGEDMIVNGQRLKDRWLEYLASNEVKMENIIIVDNDLERVRGLIAICQGPKKGGNSFDTGQRC